MRLRWLFRAEDLDLATQQVQALWKHELIYKSKQTLLVFVLLVDGWLGGQNVSLQHVTELFCTECVDVQQLQSLVSVVNVVGTLGDLEERLLAAPEHIGVTFLCNRYCLAAHN